MWSAGAVSHDLDRPEHNSDARPWYAPPQEEVPGILPVAGVVFSTPVTAMAVVGGRVFSNGLELQLELRARRGELDDDEWERVRQSLFLALGRPMPEETSKLCRWQWHLMRCNQLRSYRNSAGLGNRVSTTKSLRHSHVPAAAGTRCR